MTFYTDLAVRENASDKEIKMAYYRQMRMTHPDSAMRPNHAACVSAQHAYMVLRNKVSRAEYDQWLHKERMQEKHASYVFTQSRTEPATKSQERATRARQSTEEQFEASRQERMKPAPRESVNGKRGSQITDWFTMSPRTYTITHFM